MQSNASQVYCFYFLLNCVIEAWVPTHSYFAVLMTGEIQAVLWQFRQNYKALAWRWRRVWTFKNDIPTLYASVSTSKVCIFKLTIKNYPKKGSGLIRHRFVSLATIKPGAFFGTLFTFVRF